MADLKTQYVLTTPGGTITFNSGSLGDGTDKYWIQSIQGLDGPSIRAPVDLVPFGDGGIVHTFRKGPRRVVIDGVLLIESSSSQADCQELRNQLEQDLLDALASIIDTAGTLDWTPTGLSALQLSVYNEVGLVITHTDNFALANFSFGLIAEAADPSAGTPLMVLHAEAANANEAFAVKSFTAADSAWFGFDIWFVAGLPTVGEAYGYFMKVQEVGPNSATGLFPTEDTGTVKWWTDRATNGPFSSIVTGQWYHVDLFYEQGTPLDEDFWIDDVDQGVTNSANRTDQIDAGNYGFLDLSGDETGWEFYIANPKIGTTRGGGQLWDPTITSLADFTSTSIGAGQTLEVIPNPVVDP